MIAGLSQLIASVSFAVGAGETTSLPANAVGFSELIEVNPGIGWRVTLSELAGAWDDNAVIVCQLLGKPGLVGGRLVLPGPEPADMRQIQIRCTDAQGLAPPPFGPLAGRMTIGIWRKGPTG